MVESIDFNDSFNHPAYPWVQPAVDPVNLPGHLHLSFGSLSSDHDEFLSCLIIQTSFNPFWTSHFHPRHLESVSSAVRADQGRGGRYSTG